MKRNLKEQLNRMNFLMEIEKSEIITSDVKSFMSNLDQLSKSQGLVKQNKETFQYQKDIETIQVALILLGYPLRRYGVDGLYGSETQESINKFNTDNNIPIVEDKISQETILKLQEKMKQKPIKSEDIAPYVYQDDGVRSGVFSEYDLNTPEGVEKYKKFCDFHLQKLGPNPLGITGEMLTNGALSALKKYSRYVPPELALSQLRLEGGIGVADVSVRPIRTKNPFNVGNVDDGTNVSYDNVQNSINTYFNLIAGSYLRNKTPDKLLSNFVNNRGNRYASDTNYESKLKSIIGRLSPQTNNNNIA